MFLFFRDWDSVCSPGCPASASQVLGEKELIYTNCPAAPAFLFFENSLRAHSEAQGTPLSLLSGMLPQAGGSHVPSASSGGAAHLAGLPRAARTDAQVPTAEGRRGDSARDRHRHRHRHHRHRRPRAPSAGRTSLPPSPSRPHADGSPAPTRPGH